MSIFPGVWSLEYRHMQRQHNGYDCGPYVLNAILQDVNGIVTEGIPNCTLLRRYLTESINIVSFCTEDTTLNDNIQITQHLKQITQQKTAQPTQVEENRHHQRTEGPDEQEKQKDDITKNTPLTKGKASIPNTKGIVQK